MEQEAVAGAASAVSAHDPRLLDAIESIEAGAVANAEAAHRQLPSDEHVLAQGRDQSDLTPDFNAEASDGAVLSQENGRRIAFADQSELDSAVGKLAQIALQMDDPVQALEEGAEALAEALVAREMAERQQQQLDQALHRQHEAQLAEFQQAYRHARLHRVSELVDVGYGLDQAVALTNANEAEIRQRAVMAGRDPNAVIYEYAVRHGYRPRPARDDGRFKRDRHPSARSAAGQPVTVLERLAALNDEEFAQATQGDRWERLLGG